MTCHSRRRTCIDLLRHGEPIGGQRYRGQVDDALSEKGWQQMWAAVGTRSDWQQIITSPLLRCRDFAGSLAERQALPLTEEPRFREVGFGDWEGKTRAELEQQDPGQVVRFYRDPARHRPAGAEPLQDFTARVQAGFLDLLEHFDGQSLLVVAHAGVIRTIVAHVLQVPPATMYRIHVANAGLSRIETDADRGFQLISHGAK